MSKSMKAIEVTGQVDSEGRLHLDERLNAVHAGPVRVILLVTENPDLIEETDWLRNAATNSAFDFLNDPAEDIYSPSDGKPFNADINVGS